MWLTENPNPPCDFPYEWGMEDIPACSGPFRIVPLRFDDETEDEWCVIAEHDTDRPGPRSDNPYCTAQHTAIDQGLRYGIRQVIAREYGTRPWQDESRILDEIEGLIELVSALDDLERAFAREEQLHAQADLEKCRDADSKPRPVNRAPWKRLRSAIGRRIHTTC